MDLLATEFSTSQLALAVVSYKFNVYKHGAVRVVVLLCAVGPEVSVFSGYIPPPVLAIAKRCERFEGFSGAVQVGGPDMGHNTK